MQIHHHPDVDGVVSYNYFVLALLMRRLYRFGAYDVEGTNCHVLATVFSEVFDVYSVVHGGVWSADGSKRAQHSWLAAKDADWIVDVKPEHCLTFSPLLVYVGEGSVWADTYEEHRSEQLVKTLSAPAFEASCERLRGIIRRIKEEEPITKNEVMAVFDGYV